MVAVDVETTGRLAGFHEIIQIAVVPLTSDLNPLDTIMPFYINMAPEFPERAEKESQEIHGLSLEYLASNGTDKWMAADLFDEWFQRLNLPFRRKLVPLAHNYSFERGFLTHWLGLESFDQLWYPLARDTMLFADSINDAAAYHGLEIPFPTVSLGAMCKKFAVPLDNAHDALADCLATAELYKRMLQAFGR
jgi:DNA polymerase III epsilon subunit-like protein